MTKILAFLLALLAPVSIVACSGDNDTSADFTGEGTPCAVSDDCPRWERCEIGSCNASGVCEYAYIPEGDKGGCGGTQVCGAAGSGCVEPQSSSGQ